MQTFKYRKPDLRNRRDAAVLMHVVRNYITVAPVVHELFFSGRSTDSTRKVLRRLVDRGFLSEYPLFGNRSYYRLGPQAVARWGYPRTRTEKLGPQRLPYELGALAYTSMDTAPRKRLMPHELRRRLPWFPARYMQWAYLWEEGRLGTIRVEARTGPERVLTKLGEQVYRYGQLPEFRELIQSSRFFFVLVTATGPQELAMQREAAEQALPVELRTAHYDELIRFI